MNHDTYARPLLFRAIVKEADKLWKAIGARCGDCFAGKNPDHHKGCCGGCANLTPTGCKEKPIWCSLWTCSTDFHVPKGSGLEHELRLLENTLRDVLPYGVFRWGRTAALHGEYLNRPLTAAERAASMEAIKDLRRLSKQYSWMGEQKKSQLVQLQVN